MKKIFLLACLLLAATTSLKAQSLYETVYNSAISKVNNPQSAQEQIEVSQFEVTALNYIFNEVKKRGLEKSAYFYDSQAVNLKSFVDDFLYYVQKARAISTDKRKEVIKIYRDASLKNKLFNDTNLDRVLCYVNDTKTLTPFSLDTDWEKAYDEATAKVKAVLK